MSKRELIDTGTKKLFVRRDDKGEFKEETDVGKSLAADRRQHAKTKVKSGDGDNRTGGSVEAANAPLEVADVDGSVALLGPDGLLAVLTADAAAETGRRLLVRSEREPSAVYQKPLG
jgi:hypothetical protein